MDNNLGNSPENTENTKSPETQEILTENTPNQDTQESQTESTSSAQTSQAYTDPNAEYRQADQNNDYNYTQQNQQNSGYSYYEQNQNYQQQNTDYQQKNQDYQQQSQNYSQDNYNYNVGNNTGYKQSYNSGMDESPMTMGDWVLTLLAFMIPCAGIVLYFVWAFGKSGNINRRNYCRASLIISGVGVVLYIVIIMIFGISFYSGMMGY